MLGGHGLLGGQHSTSFELFTGMRSHVDVTPLRTTFMSPDEFGREENVVSCCECPIRKPVRRRTAARSVPGTSSSAAARGGFHFVCRSPRRRPKWTGPDRPPQKRGRTAKNLIGTLPGSHLYYISRRAADNAVPSARLRVRLALFSAANLAVLRSKFKAEIVALLTAG
ncbi:hypothetical protein MRX96_031224 [Rhipicephalus microplus]